MPTIPPLRQLFEQLIAEPSISSVSPQWDQPNARVIDLLHEWLEQLGFATQRLPVPGQPGKFNLIARAGRGQGGLVLAGHTDTVPFDESRWHSDPFVLQEKEDRWYGLGSCDMKGFFALVLEALRDLNLEQLRHPLLILATADEESSMSGARALQHNHLQGASHALIGEPTGLKPVRLHKGIGMDCIRVRGQAGHSSNPALGSNALEGMRRVLNALVEWRAELEQKYHNPLFEVPVPTLNLGHIHGGDNPNRICGECELHIDIRPLPGMHLEALRTELEHHLRNCLHGSGLKLEYQCLFAGVPPLDTPEQAAIVQAAEALSGASAQAVAFATEGPFLNRLGLNTVVLGPGHIEQAHQPDEYLPLEHIPRTLNLLKQMIRRFCLD